jgi:predicted Fe-Mo cluster-binding NifX family protein
VSFARQLGIPITGIIENMSGMLCPHCKEPIDLFGSGGGQRAAAELGVTFLGAIPVDLEIVQSGDKGKPFVHFHPESRAAKAFSAIVDRILSTVDSTAGNDIEKRSDDSVKLIAIACEDDRGMQGRVSAHFGRCPCYTMVEVKDGQVIGHRVEQNPNVTQHRPGAMPQFIRSLGANVILAGGMGPKAVDMFHSFGIEVATGAAGIVSDVLDAYLAGNLSGIVPCNHDHPDSCGAHQPHEPCVDDRASRTTAARRVAIPAVDDSGLGAAMDPRFGRAPYFMIVDVASGSLLETLSNTAAEHAHGAGTQAARVMGEQEVGAVVAGRFGPKALQVLDAIGIELWTAPEGLTVAQVLQKLQAGDLSRAS